LDWRILLSTFGLLFVAELGDKTQLAVISMAAKHKAPLAVFLGAAAALSLVTLIGALLGQTLTRVIPTEILNKIAAVSFIAMGLLVWFDVF